MFKKALVVGALVAGGLSVAVPAVQANAATLRCTSTESCGGATLADTAKGTLSLSVLKPDASINDGFGYWNEPVGVSTAGSAEGTQDFTVYQQSGESTGMGGVYGHGNYAVVYTPGGKTPNDTAFGGTGSETAYCLSVQDLYRTVRGQKVQRWATVLRNCNAQVGRSAPAFTPGTRSPEVASVVSNPNPYQLWAPVEVSGPDLEFQDVALNNSTLRHGYTGGKNFVLDDTGFGGSGTQAIAYPENDGLNQKFQIDGCTKPITVFNQAYYDCAS